MIRDGRTSENIRSFELIQVFFIRCFIDEKSICRFWYRESLGYTKQKAAFEAILAKLMGRACIVGPWP